MDTKSVERQRPGGLALRGSLLGILATLLLAAPHHRLVASPGQAGSGLQSSEFTLEGKITQMKTGRLTVDTGGNIVFDVTYDAKTEFTRKDGSAGSAKDLRVGAKIHVAGNLNDAGDVVASRIELE